MLPINKGANMREISTKVKVAIFGLIVSLGVAFDQCPGSLGEVMDGISLDVESEKSDAGV